MLIFEYAVISLLTRSWAGWQCLSLSLHTQHTAGAPRENGWVTENCGTYLAMQKIWPRYSCFTTWLQGIFHSCQEHPSQCSGPLNSRNLSQLMRTSHDASVADSSDTAYKIHKCKWWLIPKGENGHCLCFLMPLGNVARNAFISSMFQSLQWFFFFFFFCHKLVSDQWFPTLRVLFTI